MKLFIIAAAGILAFAGCATNYTNHASRGLASIDLKETINGFAEEFPTCSLGEFGDGFTEFTTGDERACVLGAIAHELKLTSDANILTKKVAGYVTVFKNLEESFIERGPNAPEVQPYSNYQTLRQNVKTNRKREIEASRYSLEVAEAMTQSIEARNNAQISKNIDENVKANTDKLKAIELKTIRLQKESEFTNYDSVRKFLVLRNRFRKAQLKDINSQGIKLNELSKKVEATYAALSRRYDGTDQIVESLLNNLIEFTVKISAIENRVKKGLDQYEKTCAASDRKVVNAFSGESHKCGEALDVLKGEMETIDNLISVTDEELNGHKEIIKEKAAKLNAAGTPQLSMTKKARSQTKDKVLSFHNTQIGVLEAAKAELQETKASVEFLVDLVEGQLAEFKANKKAFMAKQNLEMAKRKSNLEVARHTLGVRLESVSNLYAEIETDKASSPEAGLLRLTYAREMIKSRKTYLKSEAMRVNNTIEETDGYLKGFYAETLKKLKGDIAKINKKLLQQ